MKSKASISLYTFKASKKVSLHLFLYSSIFCGALACTDIGNTDSEPGSISILYGAWLLNTCVRECLNQVNFSDTHPEFVMSRFMGRHYELREK